VYGAAHVAFARAVVWLTSRVPSLWCARAASALEHVSCVPSTWCAQVAFTLAIAEEAVEFEHRDL